MVKHAETDEVTVALSEAGDRLRVTIEDAGGGSPPESWGSNLGLAGARGRIEAFGETLQVSSIPGEGTRVTIEAP